MPKGPNGERRPADTNACAVTVAKIATGEAEDTKAAKRGSAGGRARAERMSAAERKEIAERAAGARWDKRRVNMNHQLDRSVELLFNQEGFRALDVKFFAQPGSTVETLAEQIVRGFAALDDPSAILTNVDKGLTEA